MITKLNLSTHPFRNRTTPFLLALLLLAGALIGTVFALVTMRNNRVVIESSAEQVKEMRAEVARLKGEGEKVQQNLTPRDRELLVASHKLVANKQFGWSRLFADLEAVLPGSVSASRIAVENVYQDGGRIKAELDFSVLSRDYGPIMAMIENMHNSGLFQAELRGQDLQKSDRGDFTEYTLRLVYLPAQMYSTTAPDVAQNVDGGAGH